MHEEVPTERSERPFDRQLNDVWISGGFESIDAANPTAVDPIPGAPVPGLNCANIVSTAPEFQVPPPPAVKLANTDRHAPLTRVCGQPCVSDEVKAICGASCTACSSLPTSVSCTVANRIEWEPVEMHAPAPVGSLADELQKAGIRSGISYSNRGNGERLRFHMGPSGLPRPTTDGNRVVQAPLSPSGTPFYTACAENPQGTYACRLNHIYRNVLLDSAGVPLRV